MNSCKLGVQVIHFNWYKFSELTTEQNRIVLSLRQNIFFHEREFEEKDRDALHLLGMENGFLVAYLRLFPNSNLEKNMVFGRLATDKSVRNRGYGTKSMEELLAYCTIHFPGIPIKCSARIYLVKFYAKFGFKECGAIYEEYGLPHIMMLRAGMHHAGG